MLAGRALASLLTEFPDVTVEKVEFLTNMGRAREAGVGFFPTLVSGDKKLGGIMLTKQNIRGFLESL